MLTRHAHLIDVTVARGLVTFHGPIAVDEIDCPSEIIARILGVQLVRSKLTVYKEDAVLIQMDHEGNSRSTRAILQKAIPIDRPNRDKALFQSPNHP